MSVTRPTYIARPHTHATSCVVRPHLLILKTEMSNIDDLKSHGMTGHLRLALCAFLLPVPSEGGTHEAIVGAFLGLIEALTSVLFDAEAPWNPKYPTHEAPGCTHGP